MGVDTLIQLPEKTKIHEVANVISVLAGNVPKKEKDNNFYDFPGVKMETGYVVGLAQINFNCHGHQRFCLYHFESEDGGRLIMPRCTSFWLAMGSRLIDFFGGKHIFNDCEDFDDPHNHSIQEEGCRWLSSEDDHSYEMKQKAIIYLKPLTVDEICDWDDVAVYHRKNELMWSGN